MKLKSLYISSHEKSAGSLIVSMGMMEFLKGIFLKVAFFRPFVESVSFDHDIDFFISRYGLDIEYDSSYGYCVQEAEKLIADGKINCLIEHLIEKYKKLENEYDFVIVQGLHQDSFSHALDFDINLEIAKNLGSGYCIVLRGDNKNSVDIIDEIIIESQAIHVSGCKYFATFINRIDGNLIPKLTTMLQAYKDISMVYFLQETAELSMPTISDIQSGLNCTTVSGIKKDFKKVIKQTKIAAMQLDHFLEHIDDGDLIIVPGDRADIVVGAIASIFSQNYPHISAILLTGGIEPASSILQLLNGYVNFPIPILALDDDTYQTALKVGGITVRLTVDNERKIALAMGLFSKSVDIKVLKESMSQSTSSIITPVMFEYNLFQRARENKKRIVLPEALDERILRACEIVLRRDVVDIILLGNKEQIEQKSGM
ncbi:MAG: AAA family ATPase, partial [Campylobacterales bacterium]|nr:AAA family ATPase [Campylobacterales bacterium]